jgi:hypothetical protein
LTAGEAKNVDNAVVLARLFNEASGQKTPSKKHGLFISRSLATYDYVNEKKGGRGGSTLSNGPEVLATRFEDLEAFAATKSKAW